MPKIKKIVDAVNKLSNTKQQKELEKLQKGGEEQTHKREHREGLPELRNADDLVKKGRKIVLKICTIPQRTFTYWKYKTVGLNDEYAKMYNGKLILVLMIQLEVSKNNCTGSL